MVAALQQFFINQGFQAVGHSGAMSFVKNYELETFVVQLFGGNTVAMLDAQRMKEDRNKFTQLIEGQWKRSVNVRYLTVIVLEDGVTDYFRELTEQIDGLWIVSEAEQRVYVFEQQSTNYYGLYEPLTQFVETEDVVGNKKREISSIVSNLQPVTLFVVIANIFIFIVTAVRGDVYDVDYMYSVGADTWQSVFLDHEWYRLFSSMFLHFGVEHLAGNMMSLLCLGTMLEKRIGHLRFGVLYLLSGLAASFTSVTVGYMKYLYLQEHVVNVSAGASGAVFGVVGGLIAVVVFQKKWQERNSDFTPISLNSLLFMAAVTLLEGFTTSGVDNSAHAGGLVFGFLIAVLLAIKKQVYYTEN